MWYSMKQSLSVPLLSVTQVAQSSLLREQEVVPIPITLVTQPSTTSQVSPFSLSQSTSFPIQTGSSSTTSQVPVAKPHPTFIAIPSGEASMAFSATSFLDLSMEMAESLDSGRNKWHWDLFWPSNLLPTVVVTYHSLANCAQNSFSGKAFLPVGGLNWYSMYALVIVTSKMNQKMYLYTLCDLVQTL